MSNSTPTNGASPFIYTHAPQHVYPTTSQYPYQSSQQQQYNQGGDSQVIALHPFLHSTHHAVTPMGNFSPTKASIASVHTQRALIALPATMMVFQLTIFIIWLVRLESSYYSIFNGLPMFVYSCVGLIWTAWQLSAGFTLGTNLKGAAWASIGQLVGLIICIIFGGLFADWSGLALGLATLFVHAGWMGCAFTVLGPFPCCCNQVFYVSDSNL
jgi:hypothetical protein